MARFKVKLKSANVRKYMKNESVQGMLKDHADEIARRCGTGYTSDIYVGRTRANAMVKTDSYEAYRDNLKNNTILKAVY